LGFGGAGVTGRFSVGWPGSQHGSPIVQHHPLGKASRKLHKSARDRLIKAIIAMLL
jgi:hypothetical protein